ncbi:MAG: ABC transporter permease subunit [Bdellovibrionaceae bacterium]|nr:ABC transporter permease subunit [Pseudobdellovibrionaceae bacterium]
MSPTITIFKKEFRGFLFSPGFLLVCALVMTIVSWIYPTQLKVFDMQLKNAMFQQGMPTQGLNIHYAVFLRLLQYVNLMLILVVPALTMRLFAEEKKMRTFDLLLTSPVTSVQIVLGKYLAALGAILVVMGLAFLYPATTWIFASFSWLPLIVAFAGIFLVAAVYAAMNLFCSSLTESAIVAYVMAVIFNLSIWFVGIGAEIADGATIRAVLDHVSLNSHLASLVEGTVRTSSLVFFGSVIFLFGFLSERVVESHRWR